MSQKPFLELIAEARLAAVHLVALAQLGQYPQHLVEKLVEAIEAAEEEAYKILTETGAAERFLRD